MEIYAPGRRCDVARLNEHKEEKKMRILISSNFAHQNCRSRNSFLVYLLWINTSWHLKVQRSESETFGLCGNFHFQTTSTSGKIYIKNLRKLVETFLIIASTNGTSGSAAIGKIQNRKFNLAWTAPNYAGRLKAATLIGTNLDIISWAT